MSNKDGATLRPRRFEADIFAYLLRARGDYRGDGFQDLRDQLFEAEAFGAFCHLGDQLFHGRIIGGAATEGQIGG